MRDNHGVAIDGAVNLIRSLRPGICIVIAIQIRTASHIPCPNIRIEKHADFERWGETTAGEQ